MPTSTVIPCKRPKVTVDPREADRSTFDVNCRVPGCSWTYPADKQFMALKSDAEDHATRHRGEHRAAVPDHGIYTSVGFRAWCSCGWLASNGCTTRADNEATLTAHLHSNHGLVTCS